MCQHQTWEDYMQFLEQVPFCFRYSHVRSQPVDLMLCCTIASDASFCDYQNQMHVVISVGIASHVHVGDKL